MMVCCELECAGSVVQFPNRRRKPFYLQKMFGSGVSQRCSLILLYVFHYVRNANSISIAWNGSKSFAEAN